MILNLCKLREINFIFLFNPRKVAKEKILKESEHRKQIDEIKNGNMDKNELVSAVEKLFLSSHYLDQLDESLINVFNKSSEFEEILGDAEHQKNNPNFYKNGGPEQGMVLGMIDLSI